MLDKPMRPGGNDHMRAAVERAYNYLREAKARGRLAPQIGTQAARIHWRVMCKGERTHIREEPVIVQSTSGAVQPFVLTYIHIDFDFGYSQYKADRIAQRAMAGDPVAIDVMIRFAEDYLWLEGCTGPKEPMPYNLWRFTVDRLHGKIQAKPKKRSLNDQRNFEIATAVYDVHKVWSRQIGLTVNFRANDAKISNDSKSEFTACEVVRQALALCDVHMGGDAIYKAWKSQRRLIEFYWLYVWDSTDWVGMVPGNKTLWDHKKPRDWQ